MNFINPDEIKKSQIFRFKQYAFDKKFPYPTPLT